VGDALAGAGAGGLGLGLGQGGAAGADAGQVVALGDAEGDVILLPTGLEVLEGGAEALGALVELVGLDVLAPGDGGIHPGLLELARGTDVGLGAGAGAEEEEGKAEKERMASHGVLANMATDGPQDFG